MGCFHLSISHRAVRERNLRMSTDDWELTAFFLPLDHYLKPKNAWHILCPCCLCENISSLGYSERFYGNNMQVKAGTAFDGYI